LNWHCWKQQSTIFKPHCLLVTSITKAQIKPSKTTEAYSSILPNMKEGWRITIILRLA